MKIKKATLATYILLFILYSIIVFLLPFHHTAVFGVEYVFSIVALIYQVAIHIFVFSSAKSSNKNFLGFSIIYISASYLVVQLLVSVLFMALATPPMWLVLIISGGLLILSVIAVLLTSSATNYIGKYEDSTKEKIVFLKTLQFKIDSLIAKTDDTLVIKRLHTLSETIKYSDPISIPTLRSVETDIEQKADLLSALCEKQDWDTATKVIGELQEQLTIRNQKLKLLK